ncbi:MAG: 3-dehydroquinate synthase [Planctomycetaceae bacterium]|nr:3-dehydroquinate synthase [Planctomycetaceae bacterium]
MNSPDQIVPVLLGDRSYEIRIGQGFLQQSGSQISSWLGSSGSSLRTLVICDQALRESHAATVEASLKAAGIEVRLTSVPSGESSKSFGQTIALYDELVSMAADRKTVVIAVGGGVIGDLAGFVAATYARGLRFIQVPTTLLAMVDSSVGGKTGINHPQGKNLIGAFHQPHGVLIDTDVLASLPDRDFRSGLAEVVKYGVILDADFFAWLEANAESVNRRDPRSLRHIVARSCELKADVVRQDEHETTGLRAVLNYGHTYAHAFEALAGYGTLLHGEAVSIGMVCASRLAEKLGRISSQETRRQIDLLKAFELPVDVPADLVNRHDDIVACMMLDKKTEGRSLRFILPSRIGHVETIPNVDPASAISCLESNNIAG